MNYPCRYTQVLYNQGMMQTLTLHRLQQTDSQTDKTRNRLQTILNILEDDAQVRQVKEEASLAASGIETAERLLHQAEAAVNEQRIKIEQIESSLYSGATHNPKELQDLQKDVAALKRHLVSLEDRQIEAMQVLENAEAFNKTAQAQLQAAATSLLQQNQSLAGERDLLLKDIEKLGAERQAIVEALPPDLLRRYETLRQQHRGVAVARITDNSCSACGSSLTPALAQNARLANEINLCPTCGRILYGG
jgi:hypothetical protein